MHHYKGLVKPYVLWSFLLIVLPLALILLYSITTGDNSLITIHFNILLWKVQRLYIIMVSRKRGATCPKLIYSRPLWRIS